MFTEDLIYLAIKYLLEGVAVAVSAYYLTSKKTSIQETLAVGTTAATIFLLLDIFSPSIGSATRTGAGLGIGLRRVGYEPFVAQAKNKKMNMNMKKKPNHVPMVPAMPVVQGFTNGAEPVLDQNYANEGFASNRYR
ncbi:g634 [Coccomyxa elongata]